MLTAHSTRAEQFQEGLALASSGHFDRASDILVECVIAEPDNLEFVDAFLNCLSRKFRETGKTPAAGGPISANLERNVATENWDQVLEVGPRYLISNPWHVPSLLALAKACAAKGSDEVELRYLRMAFQAAPSDPDVNRHCGKSLARMRKFDEALACWERVEELAPEDDEAARMVSILTVEKSRDRVSDGDSLAPRNREEAGPSQAAIAPSARVKPRQKILLAAPRVEAEVSLPPPDPKLTPIQQLELAIREHPANADYYVQLTPLYLEKGRDYDAEKLLAKGREATGDDPQVRHLWEDVTMMRLGRKIALARKHLDADNEPATRAELERLIAERDRFETETFVSRCLREPNNAAIRYQLGLRLKRAGKRREAMQCLEQAMQDAEQKPLAAYACAECCQEEGDLPKALQHFRLAADSATLPGSLSCKKEALYQAGLLAQRIKLFRLAERYLGELLQLDPHNKAARELLRELQGRVA